MKRWRVEGTNDRYMRPGDRWECGLSRAGFPCHEGPNHQGHCPFRKPLQPNSQPGGEQEVSFDPTVAFASNDASTTKASTPQELQKSCRPRRTLWYRRQRLARGIGCLAVGVLFLMLISPWASDAIAPGDLSAAHGQILEGKLASDRCATCHPAGDHSPIELLAIGWNASDHRSQTERCLECHRNQLPDAVARSPHDFSPEQLEKLSSQRASEQPGFSLASLVPEIDWKNSKLECSTCHMEHAGRNVSLQAISNERCQACHANRFAGLAQGHPEFGDYPYNRPRALAFDHRTHSEKHFVQKNELFNCSSCHVRSDEVGVVGGVFRSVSFENACSKCHQQPINASLIDGIAFLELPSIDRRKIEKAGIDLGPWPAEASQIADGKLAPVMLWLLLADPEAVGWIQKLPASSDLADLDPTNPNSLEIQAGIAKAVRRLMLDVAQQGQRAIERRLTLVEGQNASLETVTAQPSAPQTIQPDRLAAMLQGISPDLFRSAYLDWFGASQGDLVWNDRTTEPALSDRRENKNSALWLVGQTSPIQDGAEGEDLLEVDADRKSSSLLDGSSSAASNDPPRFENWNAPSQINHGGWMIDQRRMAIVYLPNGHADRLWSAWLESAANQPTFTLASTSSIYENRVRKRLLDPKSAGNCTQCHMIEPNSNHVAALLQSPWRSVQRPNAARMLTRFNHGPHLVLPKLQDCKACHALNLQTTPSEKPTEEFIAIRKSDCANCHTASGAGDQCTTCHNYHVGQVGWEWDYGRLPLLENARTSQNAQGHLNFPSEGLRE